jgi:probable phosphoglycerate mutase
MSSADATTVLFVRHAHTAALGVWLCGRTACVSLSNAGRAQARRLSKALRSTSLAAIYSSPLERAQATALAIARYHSCGVDTCSELNEIDFGSWTGKSFAELAADPEWRAFNESRGTAAIPRGEQPGAVQDRIVRTAARLAALHRGHTIALVTHAEIVRFAVLHYRSLPSNLYHSITIEPASVTTVEFSGATTRVLAVNVTTEAVEA